MLGILMRVAKTESRNQRKHINLIFFMCMYECIFGISISMIHSLTQMQNTINTLVGWFV